MKQAINEAFSDLVQWGNFDNDQNRYDSYVVIDNSDQSLITTFVDDSGNWRETMNDAIQYAKDEAKDNRYGSYSVYGCIDNEYDNKTIVFSTDEIKENTTPLNINETSSDDEEYVEAITAWDLSDVLEKNGWCYTDSQDIFDNKTKRNGVRYVLRGSANAEDLETVIDEIKKKAIDGNHTIETSSAYYKYDPSKKMSTLIVWETTPSPQMSLSFESKLRKMVKEAVCEIGQRYNGEYDRTGMPIDDEDYVDSIDYIINSVINGNVTQVRKLVGKLTYGQFFDVIDLAREYGCEEDLRKMIK